MGRTKKGRKLSGWLVVDKPAGLGSTDVVNKVKWLLKAQKAGHAGTLDPAATGVLAVAFGEATKTVPVLTDALKCYRFAVTFGAETSTDDAEGTFLQASDIRPSTEAIASALAGFRGEIMQVPPQVSAVKVDGARAYDLAREGEVFELAARPLWVESLELIERPDADHVVLEMVCGKGGYVRAIARDLGRVLGTLAHVKWLRRTWSGPFDATDGLTWDEILRLGEAGELEDRLLPIESALADMERVEATADGARKIMVGNPGTVFNSAEGEVWAAHNGRALGLGEVRLGMFHPSRVFVQEPE
ncbi:MAG: tRNA pseudouridine(55) synthase TruB [Cypionkella sp.]